MSHRLPVVALAAGLVVALLVAPRGVATAQQDERQVVAQDQSPSPTATDQSPSPSATPSGAPTGTDGDGGDVDAALVVEFPPTLPSTWPSPPVGTARAVFAVDDATGQVLASREPELRLAVASTVKLVTALTTRRLLSLDRMVTAGPEATIGGSSAFVDPGDTWSVQDLLLGLLLRSGNDAAEVLAAADGDRDAFIAQMNATVADLGIQGATIEDPSGLADTNLLSARDLATIAHAVLADPVLAEMVALDGASLPSTGPVPNRNLLLQRLDNAIGMKTGTTDLAGASLVGAAVWQDRVMTTVVLGTVNDDARYDETEALMRFVDDIGTVEVDVGARVRLPGAWAGERRSLTLWSPADVVATTQVAVDGSAAATDVRLDDQEVATARVAVTTEQAGAAPQGGASMGQSATTTVYAALRQAVALGMVPTDGSAD